MVRLHPLAFKRAALPVAVRLSKFYPGPLRFWLQRAALVIMTLVVIALAAEYVW